MDRGRALSDVRHGCAADLAARRQSREPAPGERRRPGSPRVPLGDGHVGAPYAVERANGYSFGSKSHRKETVYDYSANLARLSERKEGETETKTRPLPFAEARDVLTTIAYLRENAASIGGPVTTDIFADGKPYRVIIKPEGMKNAEWQGRQVQARVFSVVAAPGEQKKKFPGLTVWLSNDAQRLPLRIILDQQYASFDLRLRAG